MIKDFVSNAALLIASFFIMGQIFKNKPLQPSSPLTIKLYWGLCYGILGNILMLFSIHINPVTLADLRHLAIVIAASFGGFLPAILASFLVAAGRILLFNYNTASLIAALVMMCIGIICGGLAKLNYHSALKAFFMNLIALFIISIALRINIKDAGLLKHVLIVHYLTSLLGGLVAYHFSVYIANSNEAQRQLKLNEQKLQEVNEWLNRLSYMDGLTGIGNRRYFDETLEKEWLNPTNLPLTLLMFDIDYFKKYNDTYGHLEGDRCLQTIAQAIKEKITNHTNIAFCRYGGEEFALILPSTPLEDGMKTAQLIQKTIQSLHIPHSSSETDPFITLSMGLASIVPSPFSKPLELIQKADSALYLSKSKGRNTISTVQ